MSAWLLLLLTAVPACRIVEPFQASFLCVPFHQSAPVLGEPTYEIVGLDRTAVCEFEHVLAANVSGKIGAVFDSTNCPLTKAARNIAKAGGVAFLSGSYWRIAGMEPFRLLTSTPQSSIPMLEISRPDRIRLSSALHQNSNVLVQLTTDANPWEADYFGGPYAVIIIFGGIFSLINCCYFSLKFYSNVKFSGLELSIAQVCIGFNIMASLLRSLLIIPPSCYCLPAMAFDIIRNMPWTITFPSTVLLGLYFEELSTAKVFKVVKFLATKSSKALFVLCTCVLFLSYFLYAYELQYYSLLPDGRALLGLVPRVIVLVMTCILGFGFIFFSVRVIRLRYRQVPNSRDLDEAQAEQRRRLLLLAASGMFIIAVVVLSCLLVLGYKWSTMPKLQLGIDAARIACENLVDLTQVLIFSSGKKKSKSSTAERSLTGKFTHLLKSVFGQSSQATTVGSGTLDVQLTQTVLHGEASQTEPSVAIRLGVEDGKISTTQSDAETRDSRVIESGAELNQDAGEKVQSLESNESIAKVIDEVYVE